MGCQVRTNQGPLLTYIARDGGFSGEAKKPRKASVGRL
jgi:hypothetical protein